MLRCVTSEYNVLLEIEPRVYLLRGANNARFPEANCMLLDDDVLTLVDAGANIKHITKGLKTLGHEIEDIDRIVLTHFHIDHKGHSEYIRNISECEVICHPLAVKGVESFKGMAEYYGIQNHPLFGKWKTTLNEWLPHVIGDYDITGTFTEGRSINSGTIDLIPIHTPGHTIDHTVFGINGTQTLFLVDIDLTKFGPWYGNVVSDIQNFRTSIEKIMKLQPVVGISSHLLEPVTEDLEINLSKYLQIFENREKDILSAIEDGYNTLEKLVQRPTIYPKIPRDLYYVFEEFMLLKHLEDLKMRKMITMDSSNRFKIVD